MSNGEDEGGGRQPLSREEEYYFESHDVNIGPFLSGATDAPHRFVRVNPRSSLSSTLLTLPQSTPVSWLPQNALMYAVPSSVKLKSLASYEDGSLYGIDASSAAAVCSLLYPPLHLPSVVPSSTTKSAPIRVLDLCCCPGAKLCMLADTLLLNSPGRSIEVVGVDISLDRLNVCKKMVKKYLVAAEDLTIKLYHGDGCTFPSKGHRLVFHSSAERLEVPGQKRKRMNKSARAREKRRLEELSSLESPLLPSAIELFDYVLVDAECSSDGALNQLKHKLKRSSNESSDKHHVNVSNDVFAKLHKLQVRLLKAGLANLKTGGRLVYSTCSLSQEQNEDVIRDTFKSSSGDISTERVDWVGKACPAAPGGVENTLRFSPTLDSSAEHLLSGSGFFLAKIKFNSVI